ncbi:hypothetical protein [Nocardioides sp.]|nr:hypothetical protein [Nocardioides sp.]MDO9454513.1 hypothetical protein [Nocardioides sp.]
MTRPVGVDSWARPRCPGRDAITLTAIRAPTSFGPISYVGESRRIVRD